MSFRRRVYQTAACLGGLTAILLLKKRCGRLTVRRLVNWMDPIEPSPEAVKARLEERLAADEVEKHIREKDGEVVPGSEKSVKWAGEAGQKTAICVVMFHGWSASRKECDPLPERIASALRANLFFNRLPGHGRMPSFEEEVAGGQGGQGGLTGGRGCCGEALRREATPQAVLSVALEAVRCGLALGDRVVLVGCSTGGALVTWLASLPAVRPFVAAVVLVSPAYALGHPLYPVLKHTFANLRMLPSFLNRGMRAWLIGAAVGKTRRHPSMGPAYDDSNTLTYPTTAILHLLDILWVLEGSTDYGSINSPVIMFGNPNDSVVDFRVKATNVFLQFGEAPKSLCCVTDADHPHVIASELLSPSAIAEIAEATITFLVSHIDSEGKPRNKTLQQCSLRRNQSKSTGLGDYSSKSYSSMKDLAALADAVSQPLEV